MKKSTNSSKRKRKAAIKRRKNRLKFLHKELAAAAAEPHDNEVDRISQLPDDILISIISRLTLREATATSILATRWRHLCTYITRLNFPPFKPESGYWFKYLPEIQEKRFPNYINMINQTLDSHKGGRELKEFRVHMHCLEGANIERWLEFALSREVEIFDIQMHYLLNARRGHYSLGLSNLIRKNGGQSLLGLKCLKELSLSAVHVDDREVELLLSNFSLLESLSIAYSERLRNVSIVGHSVLKLKHLDISYARKLESIEIGDMINLVSLRCYELPSTYVLRLNNVPKLTEFNTSSVKVDHILAEILPGIPSCIRDQLLHVKLSTWTLYVGTYLPTYMTPKLINVKHLELEVDMCSTIRYTYQLFPLVEACPSLEKLEIKFLRLRFSTKFERRRIFVRSPIQKLSPNLKKLKLSGYLGCPEELEIALFIIKNAVALEELIVETCDVTQKIRRRATDRAWQHFRPTTPNSVNLVII